MNSPHFISLLDSVISFSLLVIGFIAIFTNKNTLRLISFGLFLLFMFVPPARTINRILTAKVATKANVAIPKIGDEIILEGELGFISPEKTIIETQKWYRGIIPHDRRDSIVTKWSYINVNSKGEDNLWRSNYVFVDSLIFSIFKKYNFDSLTQKNQTVHVTFKCVKISDLEYESKKLLDISVYRGRPMIEIR